MHRGDGDDNQYKYLETPSLLLEFMERYMHQNEFYIITNWSFVNGQEQIKEEQGYNFIINSQGDEKKEISLKIDEAILDSIQNFNNKYSQDIDIEDYKETINRFKESIQFLK